MQIIIPTIERVFNEETKTIESKRGSLYVNIDTSFQAHLKWEEQFGDVLKCDLTTYTERVRNWLLDPAKAKAQFLGMLKLLYCYINSDKLPTFRDFCRLFDYEIADEILEKIKIVLEEVSKTVSKN